MTVVAFDGKTIAADRQSTSGGLRRLRTKLERLESGEILTYTGHLQNCLSIRQWFLQGADCQAWSSVLVDSEEFAALIVLNGDGLWVYDNGPHALLVEDDFMAFGSGREYALGALAQGASAEEAVAVASLFDNGCGLGVDTMRYEPPVKKKATRSKKR